ncbi:cyclase family protein [Meiothermus granaticius]|uniref:Putative cyclase n=1 Tax=Meiothermus granaticius NBRC 107808 TaxID=1227551 RepID=A0A399F7B8_9DEIN|nr:cyclase family protein [Meiothermus granaticius]MCL6527629.1 cyclase family protein [Thermaceae bacterium]RIH92577.1 putative cyclase [Meiothermus granaticius NBRC 107808]GEM88076.1 cyclase [Meiothermus granaticius NBRC 107808]
MNLWELYTQHLKPAIFTDLTHTFFPGQPKFPALPDEEQGHFCRLEDGALFDIQQYSFVGQWGTHVDPPLHMVPGGRSIDRLEVRETLLPLVVVNVADKAARDPDYCIGMADLEAWEAQYGPIPSGSLVAMRTDWSKRWPDPVAMANRDAQGIQHFPGWSLEVLRFLLEVRQVTAVGHETTDTDGGLACSREDSTWALEKYILAQDRWQVELLTNLDQVPEAGALVMVAWPKPKGGSGFPARVVAIHQAG